jgi:LmbE family N-acetylglucosaminyl deacetylase
MNASSLSTTAAIVAAVAAIALFGASWFRARRYRALYRIPRRRDDRFPCRGDRAALSVRLEASGFELPEAARLHTGTAFVELTVEATLDGRFREPFIEARRGAAHCRQHFERGAFGRRRINLSPLFEAAGDGKPPAGRVELRGRGIAWRSEGALELHDRPAIADAQILVVAPHPDDAEIAAFGLYAERRSWIATLTAGERGTTDFSMVNPIGAGAGGNVARENAALRVWDSLSVPRLGAVPPDRCLNLVYPDGRLEELRESPERAVPIACEADLPRRVLRARNPLSWLQGGEPGCTWNHLIAELARLIDTTKPDVVVCPHPLVDAHPDHIHATLALDEAAARATHRPRTFLLYAVHAREVPLHPVGPASGVVSLPPWSDREWLADALYSHPLSPELQRAKFFAIDSAHDDRAFPRVEPATLAGVWSSFRHEIAGWIAGLGTRPTTFLRRGPRPNEIYAVASAATLSALCARARDARIRAARGGWRVPAQGR